MVLHHLSIVMMILAVLILATVMLFKGK